MRTVLRHCLEGPYDCGAAAFVLTVAILLTHYAVKYGLNTPPATSGDELSYDSIGWNLAQGNGFAEGGGDAEFYQPYVAAGEFDSGDTDQVNDAKPETVAYRPPLFPMLLAVLNKICGRQFRAVRVMNVLATAGTCGLLVWYLMKTQGRAAACIGFVMFLAVDTRTRLYGRAILTEATATFLTTVLTILLIQPGKHLRLRTVLLLGITAGLLVLDRTVFALWLPGIVAIVFLLAVRTSPQPVPVDIISHSRRRSAVIATGCFLTTTLLVVLPWCVRNVTVLGVMMPLGTQGMSQLPAGFSDHAVDQNGVWDMEPTHRLQKLADKDSMSRLERDIARAQLGRAEALEWIRNNPGRALQLAVIKIWQEYRPRALTEWLIGISAGLGLLLSIRSADTHLFLALHAVNCVAIGCTWSVEGRFVVPLMFSMHVLAAQGLAFPFRAGVKALPAANGPD